MEPGRELRGKHAKVPYLQGVKPILGFRFRALSGLPGKTQDIFYGKVFNLELTPGKRSERFEAHTEKK